MNIPAELKAIPRWVLWRYEDRGGAKPTKVPYGVSGHPVDITQPENWATFEAVMALRTQFDGIGIVLTDDDNLTAGDLDNPYSDIVNGAYVELPMDDPGAESVRRSHMEIIGHFNTYTEWSPSNRGLRFFVWGKLPKEWGTRRGKIELYGRARFVTVTGNRVEGTPETIEHRQDELTELAQRLKLDKPNTGVEAESRPETRSDQDVYNAIINSKVGQDFYKLFSGDMSGYSSGSEADLALANYICAFTDNKEQAFRIFCYSGHYAARTKLHARTDYLVGRLINLGFDRKSPAINFDHMRQSAATLTEVAAAPVEAEAPGVMFPDGMLGDIANYIFQSAPYQVPEYALGGAIGLLAGITGRSFNIRGSGLNQYVVIVGRSGSGKDSVPNGISKLLGELETQIPAARLFLGARQIASAPALYKQFDKEKGGSLSQVSLMPEFGEWLKQHTDPRADSTKQGLIAAIMEIYGKSGAGQEAGGMSYSDRDKNVKSLRSPAFSLVGDTVAESFYEACTEAAINKGLLPRILIIERTAPRPLLNPIAYQWRPDPEFITRFGYLITRCMELNEQNKPINVDTTPEAQEMLDAFYRECDAGYHSTNSNAIGNIYSRAHLKALKLAALVAVGYNWIKPVIYPVQAAWAIDMARRDIKNLLARVNEGEIAIKEQHELSDIRHRQIAKVFLTHVTKPYANLKGQLASETNPDMHDNYRMMRASRFKNMCMVKSPWRNMPEVVKHRDYEQALKELDDVFRVDDAIKVLEQSPGKLHEWKLQPMTKLMFCFDVSHLQRIASDD